MVWASRIFQWIAIGVCLASSGCGLIPLAALSTAGAVADVSTAVISTGTEVYSYGKLNSVELTNIGECSQAVRDTMHELGLHMETTRDDDEGRYFEMRDDHGDTTKVRIQRKTSAMCQLKIDVGFFGSEPLARLVLQRIRARLPMEKPGPTTLPNQSESLADLPMR